MRAVAGFALCAWLALTSACGGGSGGTGGASATGTGGAAACVPDLNLGCSPLYPASFDQIYSRTLHKTCAASGSACHATAGNQGGLAFDDPDTAYALLLGTQGGRARVIAKDPACSVLVERLELPSPKQQMPPGNPLSAAERCAIEQWIENGAVR